MLKLRRVQDVLSQKRKRPVGLEESLDVIAKMFLDKEDPLRKAQKQKMRGKLRQVKEDRKCKKIESSENKTPQKSRVKNQSLGPGHNSQRQIFKRMKLNASTKHQVYLKFEGRCGHKDSAGQRCSQSRFLDIHHIKPVAKGGTNELNNLILLCSGHHRMVHARSET